MEFHAIANMMKESMIKPNLELFKFNGDPTAYARFVTTFETTIEAIESDDRKKLLYLIQLCGEKVKGLIDFCLLLEPSEKFAKAKQFLRENFGRKNIVARAYPERLLEGPNIKFDDSKAFIKFHRELEECLVILEYLNHFSDLNSFENIAKIPRKLPPSMQTRWLRFAASMQKISREPTFADLRSFVSEEAEIVNPSFACVLNQKSNKNSQISCEGFYSFYHSFRSEKKTISLQKKLSIVLRRS